MADDIEDQIDDDEDEEVLEDENEEDSEENPEEDLVDVSAILARLDATEKANNQLRESVARFQSLLARIPQNVAPDTKQQDAIDKSVDEVYDLLHTLASGADDAFLDPSVKARVSKALTDRRATRDQASLESKLEAMVRGALGDRVPPQGAPLVPPPADLQAMVDQLEASLVEEIKDHGLDPDDFDWEEASSVLGKSGPAGLRKHIRDAIRAAIADEGRATRRQSRKANGGKSPRGGAPAAKGEAVLKGGDEKAKREFLRSLGIAGV